MESWQKGEIAVLMVTRRAIELGFTVSKPIRDSCRYDLVVEVERQFLRLQVKHGTLKDGCVVVGARKLSWNKINKDYSANRMYSINDCDGFAIYCPETCAVYFVPIEDVSGSEIRLRVGDARNNQVARIRKAVDFEW